MNQSIYFFTFFLQMLIFISRLAAQDSNTFRLVQIDTLKSFLTYQTREFKIESSKSFLQSYQLVTPEEMIGWNLNDTLYLIATKEGKYHLQFISDSSWKVIFDSVFSVTNNPLVNLEWASATLNHFPGMRSWEEQGTFTISCLTNCSINNFPLQNDFCKRRFIQQRVIQK